MQFEMINQMAWKKKWKKKEKDVTYLLNYSLPIVIYCAVLFVPPVTYFLQGSTVNVCNALVKLIWIASNHQSRLNFLVNEAILFAHAACFGYHCIESSRIWTVELKTNSFNA